MDAYAREECRPTRRADGDVGELSAVEGHLRERSVFGKRSPLLVIKSMSGKGQLGNQICLRILCAAARPLAAFRSRDAKAGAAPRALVAHEAKRNGNASRATSRLSNNNILARSDTAVRPPMHSLAFAANAAPLTLSRGLPSSRSRCSARRRIRVSPFACEQPKAANSEAAVPAEPAPASNEPSLPSISLPPGTAAGAQALLDDLAERPQYYLNVSGVVLGLGLSIVVLSATMVALDSLPLVPDALRIVGLGYIFWFLSKFLLNGGERRRLAEEIDEFVESVKGDAVQTGMLMNSSEEERRLTGGALEKAEADLVI